MPSHEQKSKDKSLDSSEDGRSVFEYARTGSLDGERAEEKPAGHLRFPPPTQRALMSSCCPFKRQLRAALPL